MKGRMAPMGMTGSGAARGVTRALGDSLTVLGGFEGVDLPGRLLPDFGSIWARAGSMASSNGRARTSLSG